MTRVWFVLGFTCDDVVGAGQDWRFAEECLRAWQAAGRPAGCEVLETAGEGEHILLWFVNDVAARVLDERVAHWRARIIGERPTPPARGNDVLKKGPA